MSVPPTRVRTTEPASISETASSAFVQPFLQATDVNMYASCRTALQVIENSVSDIRICASDPCLNGASCLNSSSSFNFTCTCQPEYFGRLCEIDVDECPASPCQHGGFCTNLVGDYNCSCVHPYTGKNCENEIDICTTSPCKNGGRCHRQHLSYYCVCTRGWRGTNCTDKVDLCESNPCTNGGSCQDTGDDYLCSCPTGFGVHGSNEPCANTDTASSNQIFVDVNNNLTWPILAAIIGGLLCGVLLMACCCWFLLGRSKKRDDEDPQKDNKPKPRWAYARRISVTPFPIPRSSKKDLSALKSNLSAVESSKKTDDLSASEEVPALDTVADPVTMWPYMKSFNANNSVKLTSDSSAHPISNRNGSPKIFNIYRSSANDPHIHKCGKHINAEEYFQYM
ncbi:hypothetical protein CHS0354_032738 [Potamilus streckersoni]|uniref:EGF-like domain-containing protein n=1 Tax=Potamilus streckersoni TaxID=2493646 RepID=A0AAE0TJF0_9BIVA|nr:hypothetical protein CHS0354_032738 [Potamilus streckersoni]